MTSSTKPKAATSKIATVAPCTTSNRAIRPYGRHIYEVMRYWDERRPNYSEMEREFGVAWRAQPKWVASRTLESGGPTAVDRIAEDTVRLTYVP